MKIKLIKLEELSKQETFYIIGGQVNPDNKKDREVNRDERKQKREERKTQRKTGSNTTDTIKNDSFKI